MPRSARKLGPSLWTLLEDAPVDLIRKLIAIRESENEQDFPDIEDDPAASDDEVRAAIAEVLEDYDRDDLKPLETRCRRILQLAEGKGTASLDGITRQELTDAQSEEYDQQPDALCRSIWTFLHHRSVFDNAESFYFARQFRDYDKLYDAFEVELDKAVVINATAVNEQALAARVTAELHLKTACTVRVIDLPTTDAHPASVMVIIRHGGPLSSVHDHRNDGQRDTIYYRPPNEAVLIYTPSTRQIEACADSPRERQITSSCFAEEVLHQDVSSKPLKWRRYNLSRFRDSLELPVPYVDGYEIIDARVLEVEVRLGSWKRRLNLKVTEEDQIFEVADRFLGRHNVIRQADSFSRIVIALKYELPGEAKRRSLNITISGPKSCNLQSKKDPGERALGYAVLREWGILSSFRQMEYGELTEILPQLLELYERVDEEFSGAYLREQGLDPDRLIEGGLLERLARQDIIQIEEEGLDGASRVQASATPGMVQVKGPFDEDGGLSPAADFRRYQLNHQWLRETVIDLMKPWLSKSMVQRLNDHLTFLGTMRVDSADIPVYLGRRLDNLDTIRTLDMLLRGRNSSGIGMVLSTNEEHPHCLGPNTVVPISSHLTTTGDRQQLDRGSLEFAYRAGRNLAMGSTTPTLHRSGQHTATLVMPGKPPLALTGANQILIFNRLVKAHNAGSPDVKASELTEGLGSSSPQHAFRKAQWDSIRDVYLTKGAKHGYWRLAPESPALKVAV